MSLLCTSEKYLLLSPKELNPIRFIISGSFCMFTIFNFYCREVIVTHFLSFVTSGNPPIFSVLCDLWGMGLIKCTHKSLTKNFIFSSLSMELKLRV